MAKVRKVGGPKKRLCKVLCAYQEQDGDRDPSSRIERPLAAYGRNPRLTTKKCQVHSQCTDTAHMMEAIMEVRNPVPYLQQSYPKAGPAV